MVHCNWDIAWWLLNWYDIPGDKLLRIAFDEAHARTTARTTPLPKEHIENILLLAESEHCDATISNWRHGKELGYRECLPLVLDTNSPELFTQWLQRCGYQEQCYGSELTKSARISGDMLRWMKENVKIEWGDRSGISSWFAYASALQRYLPCTPSAFVWAIEERGLIISRLQGHMTLKWVQELFALCPELKEKLGPCPFPVTGETVIIAKTKASSTDHALP